MEHMQPRYETLMEQLRRAGALQDDMPGRVTAKLCDFMKQSPDVYPQVTHMLLDPSCSGSGILGRLDYLTDEQESGVAAHDTFASASTSRLQQQAERLQGLAAFQRGMIEHAMRFPSLRRLVYSTCSIHHEENEDVVVQALQSDVAKQHGWRLATRGDVIPTWPTRGLVEHCQKNVQWAEAMIRCAPGGTMEDEWSALHMEATNGFFVACFLRDEHAGDVAQRDAAAPGRGANAARNKKRKWRAKEKERAQKRARHGEDEGKSV